MIVGCPTQLTVVTSGDITEEKSETIEVGGPGQFLLGSEF